MCRTDPPNGDSSGTTLGVPFKALLHRHNAAVHIGSLGTALQRGESSVAGTSPTTQCSTIGDAELNDPVRNGKGWDLSAITT